MWIFGGGRADQETKTNNEAKKAILGLRSQLDMLQKREKHLMTQIDEQDAIARKNVNTNKNAAKAALRRKKAHEHTLDQTLSHIGAIEQNIYSLESANINSQTFNAIQNAGKAMKRIHGNTTLEKIEDTMASIQEQHEINEEISNAVSSSIMGNQVDDTELEDELEQLQQEQLDMEIANSGSVPVSDAIHRMPAAVNGEIKGKPQAIEEDDEEAELRKLQAEMAM